MEITILGKGCKKCNLLEAHALEASEMLSLEATFKKVTDINEIADYGVMQTPALAVDGKVVLQGRVPSAKKLAKLLSEL